MHARRVMTTAIAVLTLWTISTRAAVLYGPDTDASLGPITKSDADYSTIDQAIQVRTGTDARWPGVTIQAPDGKWDLSDDYWVAADLRNVGETAVTVHWRVDNPGADGRENCITQTLRLAPGERNTLTVNFYETPWVLDEPLELIGMRGNPKARGKLDPANITQMIFFVTEPKQKHAFEILRMESGGEVKKLDADTFIPFIDRFGQFVHDDWPGKTHSEEQLQKHLRRESRDLQQHPGPRQWNQYGGWQGGPQLEPTGFFRVTKHQEKWWLVDPEGRLFWSHGMDCVRPNNDTPISDRENYFKWLPDEQSAFGTFYGSGSWAPHGYYNDHSPYRTYDFTRANLLRKYGDDWYGDFADITHRRLRSWGMNTIANWSDPRIFLMRRTPYTGTISFGSRVIEGSEGYWGKFFDVFDPSFRENCIRAIEGARQRGVGDPWCIGFFVHNEIAWGGDGLSLALASLQSPADQPAKKQFISDLRRKYDSIDKLNDAWAADYRSWDDLLHRTDVPDKQKAEADLAAFYTTIAETYFRIIHDELEQAAPKQMYFGPRFAWVNDRAAHAAAKFCDVVAYNRYAYSVADHRMPDGIDLPIIVGEFHFGALDRGMFHTGLKPTRSQEHRAQTYRDYVRGALRNRYIVGTHWFQYKDQATTGRGDGENYQIGFVDACDTPYPETIAASRDIGYTLYEYRLNN